MENKMEKTDITICIPYEDFTISKIWVPWLEHQILKQTTFLKAKGLTTHVIISTFDEKIKTYFKKLGYTTGPFGKSESDIGSKRNAMKKMANSHYIANMDSDDWYPNYRIYAQWQALALNRKNNEIGVCSSNRIICYDIDKSEFFYKYMNSESTLFYTKKYSNNNNFGNCRQEGDQFHQNKSKLIIIKDIELIVAFSHKNNSTNRITDIILNDNQQKSLKEDIKFDVYEKEFLDQFSIDLSIDMINFLQ